MAARTCHYECMLLLEKAESCAGSWLLRSTSSVSPAAQRTDCLNLALRLILSYVQMVDEKLRDGFSLGQAFGQSQLQFWSSQSFHMTSCRLLYVSPEGQGKDYYFSLSFIVSECHCNTHFDHRHQRKSLLPKPFFSFCFSNLWKIPEKIFFPGMFSQMENKWKTHKPFLHQFSSHKHSRQNNLDQTHRKLISTRKNKSSLTPQGFCTSSSSDQMKERSRAANHHRFTVYV